MFFFDCLVKASIPSDADSPETDSGCVQKYQLPPTGVPAPFSPQPQYKT